MAYKIITSCDFYLKLNKRNQIFNTTMVYCSTIRRERSSNCVRYYIFCERNISRWQPLRSVLIFILSMNPLSVLLHNIELQRKRYNRKVMHGFYEKKLEQYSGIDRSLSFLWKKDRYVTYLRYKRVLDKCNIPNHKINVECICLV